LDTLREQTITQKFEEIQQLLESTKKLLETIPDPFSRGFTLAYVRPKFEQGGGNHKTDYLNQSNRKHCEQNVLTFAFNQ
jgi:hypothetical protein